MSWDVLLLNVDKSITDLEQFDTQEIPALGSKTNVVSRIKEIFPDITLSDPDWGFIHRPNFSIEFNMASEDKEILDALMLHIRGGDEVIDAVRALCEATNWRAFDTTTGSFINFNQDPSRGLRKWRDFRNKVVAQMVAQGEEVTNKKEISSDEKKKKSWWQFWK